MLAASAHTKDVGLVSRVDHAVPRHHKSNSLPFSHIGLHQRGDSFSQYRQACRCVTGDNTNMLQLGFFNIVGTPLFQALVDLFPDAQPVLDGVKANYQQWHAAAAQTAAPQPPAAVAPATGQAAAG